MSKFKVGDRVQILRSRYTTLSVGEITRVVVVYPTGVDCQVTDANFLLYFSDEELELVRPDEETLSKTIDFISTAHQEGVKHDLGKPPISLIPVEAIIGEADVFGFGAKKYGRHNFRLGMDHTRVLDAAMRHVLAIINGEDIDPESGKPHWAHARCCLAMYAYYQTNKVGNDDRYKGSKPEEKK